MRERRKAAAAVRRCMTLAVRTLALPADVLALGPRNVVRLANGNCTLRSAREIRAEFELAPRASTKLSLVFATHRVRGATPHVCGLAWVRSRAVAAPG